MTAQRGKRRRWMFRDGGGGLALNCPSGCDTAGGSEDQSTRYPDIVRRILLARGEIAASDSSIDEQIGEFLETSLHDLHEASLLPGAVAAAQRLMDAVKAGKRIAIYGDYDVDGITATAILYHMMKTAQPEADVQTYVPHRLNEGYGINADAFDTLKSDGVDLVISVDCGISAVKAAAHARAIGLDLIITDHHNLPGENSADLPDAEILVHPRLPGSSYPWGELCGAGVAFKVAWHFAVLWSGSTRVTESFRKMLTQLLALVALGTIADVVPLKDENRTLTKFGLKMMRHTEFAGLNALIEASGLADEKKFDSDSVGFRLGPRLNACGRMGHAAEAITLFTTATDDEAVAIAQNLDLQNRKRQQTEREILEQACRLIEENGMDQPDCRIIVLAQEDWHPGVVGIVCSRLVEKYGRPAILLDRDADRLKGSGRSIDGYSLYDGLATAKEILTTWGGHDMAAGLTLPPEHFSTLVDRLNAHANTHIVPEDLIPVVKVDCEARLIEFSVSTLQTMMELGPFGRSNAYPTFLVRNLRIQNPPKSMGSAGKHMSLQVQDSDQPGRLIRLVGWGMGDLVEEFAAGQHVDIVMRPKISRWKGFPELEAEIRDIRASKD